MKVETIAVLMTCYNRRETTLKCLEALYAQELPSSVYFDVYLVDDGCTDGTGESVRELFPNVTVIQGDGNLYWCGGMRLAWSEAMKKDYDCYLWLNDDTILFTSAISTLLRTLEEIGQYGCEPRDGIIVGSCRDANTGKQSYGGRIQKNLNEFVTPADYPQPCDMLNGNVALIPRKVKEKVGNLSPGFRHTSGDYDYGLRAIKEGFMIWVAPGFQGLCSTNAKESWTNPNTPLCKRWRQLHATKGQPPYETYVFARRHSGYFWMLDVLKLYIRVLFPRRYERLKGRLKSLNRRWQ